MKQKFKIGDTVFVKKGAADAMYGKLSSSHEFILDFEGHFFIVKKNARYIDLMNCKINDEMIYEFDGNCFIPESLLEFSQREQMLEIENSL